MQLMIVKRGRALHWPADISDAANRLRCMAGDIIDLDAPLERERLCKGQEYKLQAAPEGKTADDIAEVQFRPAANIIRDERERLAAGGKVEAAPVEDDHGIAEPVAPDAPAADPLDESFPNASEPKKPGRKSGRK